MSASTTSASMELRALMESTSIPVLVSLDTLETCECWHLIVQLFYKVSVDSLQMIRYISLMLTYPYHSVICFLSVKFPLIFLLLLCFLVSTCTLSCLRLNNLPLGNFSSGLPFLAAARRTSMSVHLTLARMVAPVQTTLANLSACVWKSMWVPPVLN